MKNDEYSKTDDMYFEYLRRVRRLEKEIAGLMEEYRAITYEAGLGIGTIRTAEHYKKQNNAKS